MKKKKKTRDKIYYTPLSMGPKLERKARKKNKKTLYGSTDLHIKFINFNNKSTLAYKNT